MNEFSYVFSCACGYKVGFNLPTQYKNNLKGYVKDYNILIKFNKEEDGYEWCSCGSCDTK